MTKNKSNVDKKICRTWLKTSSILPLRVIKRSRYSSKRMTIAIRMRLTTTRSTPMHPVSRIFNKSRGG